MCVETITKDPENCASSNNGYCTSCEYGYGVYQLDDGPYYRKCVSCKQINPGCANCDPKNVSICYRCADYYYMDREDGSSTYGRCIKCDVNCKNCTSKGCVRYRDGLGLNENKELVKCEDENCANCFDYKKCTECIYGYTLFNGICVECNISNCDTCVRSKYECQDCDDGYVPVGGTCKKCSEGCKTCYENQTCYKTSYPLPGYAKRGNKYVKCAEGCSICNPYNLSICYSCLDGYYSELLMENDLRYEYTYNDPIIGTTRYNYICHKTDIFNCTVDKDTYQVAGDEHHCFDCKKNYGVDENGNCTQCADSNCIYCNTNYKICTPCISQFAPDENGKCVMRPDSQLELCKDYDENGCCECVSGSRLNENYQCERCSDENCFECKDYFTKCSKCKKGYALNKTSDCTKCIVENCNECDPNNLEQCLDCSTGYRLNATGQCVECNASNCETCNFNSYVCDSCAAGYAFNLTKGSPDYKKCSIRIRAANCAVENNNDLDSCSECIDPDYWIVTGDYQCIRRWSPPPAKKKGLSAGAIAGIVVGCVAAVGIVTGLLVYFLVIRKKGIGNSASQDN